MSILNKLTEGIVNRNLQKEGAALLNKWEQTGLLEGLEDNAKQGMARLLENQAKELLREASSMAAGDVEGFAAVAFPIVRRVFGGLIANDLVSVQPMSLPSGLIFFLDFTYQGSKLGLDADDSVYGGGVTGSAIRTGGTDFTEHGGGFYGMSNAYAHATGSNQSAITGSDSAGGLAVSFVAARSAAGAWAAGTYGSASYANLGERLLRWDADLSGSSNIIEVVSVEKAAITSDANGARADFDNLGAFSVEGMTGYDTTAITISDTTMKHHRRLNCYDPLSGSNSSNPAILMVFERVGGTATLDNTGTDDGGGNLGFAAGNLKFPTVDSFVAGDGVGSVVGADGWPLEEPNPSTGNRAQPETLKNTIPEIDIRVESVAVTAVTKKLKAKWSPELGQDLNAYHNLDAEVELTSILSEQVALEIDREILADLIHGATAATYYWSRKPGKFVVKTTGAFTNTTLFPDFTGTVSEWYETLVETINDVSAQIHRKTLRGGANFIVTSPELANVLEFTSGFRANVTADGDKGTVGTVKSGNLSKKWDVYVDPYFPRNVVLVGRRGGSFLESGYVYAPYVPLQTTPTIFGTEDFVPRKGVMTRYAKKMVRADMYGVVIVQDLLG